MWTPPSGPQNSGRCWQGVIIQKYFILFTLKSGPENRGCCSCRCLEMVVNSGLTASAKNWKLIWFLLSLKLRCDTRFQRVFTACGCVFKVITLVRVNQEVWQRSFSMVRRDDYFLVTFDHFWMKRHFFWDNWCYIGNWRCLQPNQHKQV